MRNKYKIFVVAAAVLCSCQVAVVLLSWILSVLLPTSNCTSLLSGAGLRWLLSSYAENVNTNLFFYFLLLCFAVGAFCAAGIPQKIASFSSATYHERLAVGVVVSGIVGALLLSILAAIYPHSIMLSVEGTLVPGPYLKAVLILFVAVLSVGSGLFVAISGGENICKRITHALTAGLRAVVPLMIIYFLLMELICMTLFVLHG